MNTTKTARKSRLQQAKLDFATMPLDSLVNYILDTYHAYIRKEGPALLTLMDKVVEEHGEQHPSLFETRELFKMSLTDLYQHLDKEENVIFPYTLRMVYTLATDGPSPFLPMGTIAHPIEVMEMEHSNEQQRYAQLEDLTGGYETPEDVHADYVELMARMADFDVALHDHIALENTYAFPRIIDLETELHSRHH